MSAKAVSPSSRDQWRTVFPLNEAQRAAKFLRDTWEELVTTKPQGFRATLRENKLTEKLYIYLARTSTGKGRLSLLARSPSKRMLQGDKHLSYDLQRLCCVFSRCMRQRTSQGNYLWGERVN